MYLIWAEIWNLLKFFVAFLSPRDFISAGDIPIKLSGLKNMTQSMWYNCSVGYSCLCCCRSVSWPWRIAKSVKKNESL